MVWGLMAFVQKGRLTEHHENAERTDRPVKPVPRLTWLVSDLRF